jgi:hypothetical protein
LNNRTHRKLLVVDGQIGFTGGVGIADPWTGHAQDPEHWRDSHYRVQGPIVAQMQAVFMDNWIKVSGDVLHGAEYFPCMFVSTVLVTMIDDEAVEFVGARGGNALRFQRQAARLGAGELSTNP